ncbi:MAG: hypothetical protein HY654_11285 [Acidobacteria bacterium]|nr:hypothetical protein [Acidobacteriota bacterium]
MLIPIRQLIPAAVLAAVVLVPSMASSQIRYGTDRATGETYHVEFAAGLWSPTPQILVTSESLGIRGTTVDFVADLGIEKNNFPEFRLVGRPATKHKFRLSYVPIKYTAATTINREIIFNGQRFRFGVPVEGLLEWRAWRIGYEYDFIYRERGFAGFITEAKYTDVSVTVASPLVSTEFARARAPIPALGGIGRVYVAPNISITAEVTGFAVPDIDEEYDGKYVDFDLYGTVNYTDHFGGQVGYRRIDVNYLVKQDAGDLKMSGLYFMGVVRF